jgi:hypothetical protein
MSDARDIYGNPTRGWIAPQEHPQPVPQSEKDAQPLTQAQAAALVVPPSDNPLSQGYYAWPFDAVMANGNSTAGNSNLPLSRMVVQADVTSVGLTALVTVAAVTPTAGQCGAALYDALGNLLAFTRDIGSALTSIGVKDFTWTTPVSLSKGQIVYGGVWMNASTPGQLGRAPLAAGNGRAKAGSAKRFLVANNVRTAAPGTVNLVNSDDSGAAFWFALR